MGVNKNKAEDRPLRALRHKGLLEYAFEGQWGSTEEAAEFPRYLGTEYWATEVRPFYANGYENAPVNIPIIKLSDVINTDLGIDAIISAWNLKLGDFAPASGDPNTDLRLLLFVYGEDRLYGKTDYDASFYVANYDGNYLNLMITTAQRGVPTASYHEDFYIPRDDIRTSEDVRNLKYYLYYAQQSDLSPLTGALALQEPENVNGRFSLELLF
jgi:hypothetical protein